MKTSAFVCLVILLLAGAESLGAETQDADKKDDLRLEAPTGWKGERIALPPTFARDMKLKGIEEIRFAPGMFSAESDSFFSYVFVFRVELNPELTKEVLHREMLAYYRGLAAAVLKGRDVPVAPKSFTLGLKAVESEKDPKRPAGLTRFDGELDWVEPFVTRKPQTLHFEFEMWQDVAAKHGYLFVIASPKSKTDAVWNTMRKIRASFHSEDE
jgi:hypothetical protein